jgi:glycosyltransferase involved in cell wall biosynthesis
MRVLYVIDHLGVGGAQHSVKNIVENIGKYGVEPCVCALRPAKPAVHINGQVIILKYARYDPRALFGLVAVCRQHHIDIIHTQLGKSNLLGVMAGMMRKIPVVTHERGDIFAKGRSFAVYRALYRFIGHFAFLIIANSNATAACLKMVGHVNEHKIRVLYNAVDTAFYDHRLVSKTQARRRLDIQENDIVVGFVGRFHAAKGVDILIEAFGLLAAKHPDFLLVLAGDGPDRQMLTEQVLRLGIGNRVRFLGMCDNVPEIMAAFDIGVVPSRQESFGRVAIELMRMRVPVATSGIDGLAEIVQNEKTGLVTQKNTPQHIAAAIERLANDTQLQNMLIENAHAFSEQFGIEQYLKILTTIYDDVAHKSTERNQ